MAAATSVNIRLPYPPSVNHVYGRARGGRTFLKPAVKAYRENCGVDIIQAGWPRFGAARLAVTIQVYPPTAGRCDLDNLGKAVLDALTHCQVWEDDGQVDDLRFIRCAVLPPRGLIVVEIRRL